MLRDDAIALWEWYRRERLVSFCMEVKHGFSYWPATSTGRGHMRRIARYLSIPPIDGPGDYAHQKNEAYVNGLDQATHTRYALALWGLIIGGESVDGGCSGLAEARIPGLWQETRLLRQARDRMRFDPARYAVARWDYRACMTRRANVKLDTPGASERFLATAKNMSSDARAAVLEEMNHCDPTSSVGSSMVERRLAKQFLERYREELEKLRSRYATVITRIRSDRDFADYLRQETS